MWILLAVAVGICATGCGKKEEEASAPAEVNSTEDEILAEEPEEPEEEEEEEEEPEVAPEGMYASELTNEWIS